MTGPAEETADIESLSSVSEVEATGPGGAGVRVKGQGPPADVARVVVGPAFSLTGFASATAVLAAGRPFWQACALFAAAQVAAAVWWRVGSVSRTGTRG